LNSDLWPSRTTIEALEGDTHLERVRLHNTKTGASETRDIQHVFMMTGADPNTEWLRGSVASMQRVSSRPVRRFKTAGLCTDLPFPRSESVKRVASAVGEGSMVVQFVDKVLAE
jgi:thioredoxin reductase (NADPH)